MSSASWSDCGGAWISGFRDGEYLGAPVALVPQVRGWFQQLRVAADSWSPNATGLDAIDPLALLGERAAIEQLQRDGRRSCGGNSFIAVARDGEIALGLARPYDREILGAWLAGDSEAFMSPNGGFGSAELQHLLSALALLSTEEIQANARVLGIPIAIQKEVTNRAPSQILWAREAMERSGAKGPRILDLTALWAGPLATNLLMIAGAEVIKAESPRRRDGFREGSPHFFRILNSGKTAREIDPTTADGKRQLLGLMAQVDVVVESARSRALAHLGIEAEDQLDKHPHLSWVSITAYGRMGADSHRVGFGDDVAFAGGLHGFDAERCETTFLGDAIADPLTGICTAGLISEILAAGEQRLVDVAMARVAAACSQGENEHLPEDVTNPKPPEVRQVRPLVA